MENRIDGVVTSTYDAGNRLLKSEAFSGITTYTYDASGNRRTVEEPTGDLTTYTWDAENHLVQVELPTSEIVTYTWAPINKANEERLVQRDDGVDIRRSLWDNNNVLRETDDLGAVAVQYTYAPEPYGDLISQHADGDSTFHQYDALGSTTGLTDESGVLTDTSRYEAFGKPLEETGPVDTPYRWVGQQGYRHDDATGHDNLRSRDYDPQAARFLSEDPLGTDAGDSNFYRYVANSPINKTDPSGLVPESQIYTNGLTVYANTGVLWDTYVGYHDGGEPVVRDVGGVAFTVSYWTLTLFASQYWTSPPPGSFTPVSQWGRLEWNRWFVENGTRKETNPGGFDPQPSPKPYPPTFNPGGDFPYEDWDKQQKELARRKRSEELLAKATEFVLAGGGQPVLTPIDGGVVDVNPAIDPGAAKKYHNCPPGHISGSPNSQSCGSDRFKVPPHVLHERIQAQYRQLLQAENSWTPLEALHFTLDLVGLVPVGGSLADLTNATIYSIEGQTGPGLIAIFGAIPIVGDAAVVGKTGVKAVKNAEKLAVEAEQAAGTTCTGAKLVVRTIDDVPVGSTPSGVPTCPGHEHVLAWELTGPRGGHVDDGIEMSGIDCTFPPGTNLTWLEQAWYGHTEGKVISELSVGQSHVVIANWSNDCVGMAFVKGRGIFRSG